MPVRRPRWMNCITSATETSLRLPEIPMDRFSGVRYSPRASLTRLSSVRSLRSLVANSRAANMRRRGVGGEQVEQVAVLGPQDRLVVEQLQHHQRADDVVLHPQRHRRERLRLGRRPEAEHAVPERLVDHRVAARGSSRRRRAAGRRRTSPPAGRSRSPPPSSRRSSSTNWCGAEEVDGDLGDRRLHLGRIERRVELVGGDVEVHQPAALVLGVDQAGGELLDVRLGGGEPAARARRRARPSWRSRPLPRPRAGSTRRRAPARPRARASSAAR